MTYQKLPDREIMAMIIHKAVTQIPEKEPHECDYAAADEILDLLDEIGVAVDCTVCHRRKKPVGRSAPIHMAGSLCDFECSGYYSVPQPGQLWPGERRRDFGF